MDKKADSAIDFVKTKVIPVYGMLQIPTGSILTDNGKGIPPIGRMINMTMIYSWLNVVSDIPELSPGVPRVTA